MFTRMAWYSRLLAVAGLVLIFYPSFTYEVVGMLTMMVVLSINLYRRGLERRAQAVAPAT